jgi:hypothetical protein
VRCSYNTFLPTEIPMMKKMMHITRKRKNRNFAIPAAAAAMPVNPNNAATSAMIRKITAQRNMVDTSLINFDAGMRSGFNFFAGSALKLLSVEADEELRLHHVR